MKNYNRYGYQSMETVSGENATLRFKSFQNTLLQSNKVSLGIEAALTDVSDPSNLNRVKKHEDIAISFAHG